MYLTGNWCNIISIDLFKSNLLTKVKTLHCETLHSIIFRQYWNGQYSNNVPLHNTLLWLFMHSDMMTLTLHRSDILPWLMLWWNYSFNPGKIFFTYLKFYFHINSQNIFFFPTYPTMTICSPFKHHDYMRIHISRASDNTQYDFKLQSCVIYWHKVQKFLIQVWM